MPTRYFVAYNNLKIGPMSEADLVGRIRSGEYTSDMLGWREGTPDWATLRELFPQYFNRPLPDPALPAGFYPAPGGYAAPGAGYRSPDLAAYAAAGIQIATFGERFVALLIDCAIFFIPNLLITVFFAGIATPVQLVIWLLYGAQMLAGPWQGTVGMRAMKIRVITETGGNVDSRIAWIRFTMSFVSSLIFCIGYFWSIWDPRSQTLHDKVACTLVVKG